MTLTGEGSVARPYRENPPTHFAEVHWRDGLAVQWPADQYVHAGGLTIAPNSPVGTLSVWLKYNIDTKPYRELTLIDGNLTAYWLRHAPGDMTGHGSGDMSVDFAPSDPLDMRPVSIRFDLAMVNSPGVYSLDGIIYDFNHEGSMVSDGVVFGAADGGIGHWWHVYCEWNTQAGNFTLKVNGRTVSAAALPGTTVGTESNGTFGFDVPWNAQPVMPGRPAGHQNTVFFWWELPPSTAWPATPLPYSIAEFWLDPGRTGVGVDKFVDLETGRPRNLGTNGETPLAGMADPPGKPHQPAFYFHRAGEPKTFLENRGYAGSFTLAKTTGETEEFMGLTRETLDPDVPGNGPLDEPDNPHFTPET